MPNSMTGYGRASVGSLTVELRAVNHRYLEVSVRTPRGFLFLEEPLKSLAQKSISRGKLEVTVTSDSQEMIRLSFSRPVWEGYLAAAAALEDEYGLKNDLTASSALRLPDIMSVSRSEPEMDTVTERAIEAAEAAFADFQAFRAKEGARLAEDIREKLVGIERLAALIAGRMPEIVSAYRERLRGKLAEVLESKLIDESRILTEAALYADRICVDEELVRLRSHIASFRDLLSAKGAAGKKMDFLIQEFAREVNTVGSKCGDSETVGYVIDLKSEIEKIREQIQNIE
ncbi:MAG: YicC family protein [Oscillospiraceae bacterium]|nr:YicC family protein [Oscillospiraceae bacterium]